MRSLNLRLVLCVVGLVAVLPLSALHAGTINTINSADFSFAYGAVNNSSVAAWGTEGNTEGFLTSESNFAVTTNPRGVTGSTGGPVFQNRILTDGREDGDVCGYVNALFTVPISAQYIGAAPSDVSSTPNYALNLVIDSVSVYGLGVFGGMTSSTLAWNEVGGGSSSPAALKTGTGPDYITAASYTKVAWNPGDSNVAISVLNQTITRTFGLTAGGDVAATMLDGIQFAGHVELSYNAVPEPCTLVLLATGLIGLLAYAWRKRR